MSPKKHDWASLQRYMNAHERVMNTYAKFMDRPRTYEQTLVTPNYLLLECKGILFTTYNGNQVRVDISKDVEIDDAIPKRPQALTVLYSYNANRPDGDNLIRYDSPDPPAQITPLTPLHHHFHHKHVWVAGREQILRAGDDAWPHVEEFFQEIMENF